MSDPKPTTAQLDASAAMRLEQMARRAVASEERYRKRASTLAGANPTEATRQTEMANTKMRERFALERGAEALRERSRGRDV